MDYPGKVITKTQVTPTQTSASGNWTLDDQAAAIKNNNWPVALVPNPISKSLRFNSADSAYLNRTPASAGNRRTFTWSGWVKRSALGESNLFSADTATGNTGYTAVIFNSTDNLQLQVREAGVNRFVITSSVYRDVSSWYHVVIAIDTTQATAANRRKMYVNGVEITAFGTSNDITQNFDTSVNNTVAQQLGVSRTSGSGFEAYNNGYMTEINFIDGQALTPSSFGMTNPQTGQWIPLKYSGTYGTNGFYLNFKDATSTTTLGYDYSGNANNWTTNNFSVTAGAGNDSLTDVPTPWTPYNTTGDVGGVVRGNYATLNPLFNPTDTTLSNGNLKITTGSTDNGLCLATIGVYSGKWYWEVLLDEVSGDGTFIGITTAGIPILNYLGEFSGSYSYASFNGQKYNSGSGTSYGATYATNDIVGVAFDADAGTLTFYKNGASQGTAYSSIPAGTYFPGYSDASTTGTEQATFNFGQRPFAYTPPTGFRSLCTTNLPATAIGFGLTNQGNNYFDATTYTGNGANPQNIVNSAGMAPDLVWTKSRSAVGDNFLADSLRGAGNILRSNLTAAEAVGTGGIQTLNTNGFGVNGNQNDSGVTYVGWQWRASNAAGVTNTAGTITSTVSANTTAGFSVVTYTGVGNAGDTVGHGLGVAPRMIIIKWRTGGTTQDWIVYHASIGATKFLELNTTDAEATSSTRFNDTAPSSTVFTLGTNSTVNASTYTYVAYCFAAVPGYSAFGSYTGNGSADGPFVYLGFRPRYVMIKRTDSTSDWTIYDTSRSTYNQMNLALYANLSNAEGTTIIVIDTVSNGIKIRNSNADTNASGGTYIYAAFAEFPFQFANAR